MPVTGDFTLYNKSIIVNGGLWTIETDVWREEKSQDTGHIKNVGDGIEYEKILQNNNTPAHRNPCVSTLSTWNQQETVHQDFPLRGRNFIFYIFLFRSNYQDFTF